MTRKPSWYGVAAIPNQCSICGKFRAWKDLETQFVPDSDFSSESQSYRECKLCLGEANEGR